MKIKSAIKKLIKIIFAKRPIQMTAKIIKLAPTSLLEGRIALITGGTSGIGLSIAKAMIDAGANVIITGRNGDRINKAIVDITKETSCSSDRIRGVVLDSCKIDSFEAKFEEIISLFGSIDILVNNAGVQAGTFGSTTEFEYDKVLDTNLKGSYFLSQIVAKYMKSNNIKGNILNIASSSSLRPANNPYILSKWGIRGLTLGLAKMMIPYGVVVNGLAPGPTATPMILKDDKIGISNPNNPMGRLTTPEEIANMAVVLTSGLGKSIIGDIVYMTGGAGITTFDDITCNL